MNINPQSTLRLVRQLTDPSDVGINYVQATARNSATGDIVATVNLTDAGNQRFTGSLTTPADASGMGYYLDVTTKVYTDAGYTTLNTNYAIETMTYFVYQQSVHIGGGGADVSYDKIRKIVKEELDAQEKTELPEIRDVVPELLASERRVREAIGSAVAGIKMPEQVRPDLDGAVARLQSAIDDAVNTLLIAVDQKEVTPETDIEPIMQDMRSIVPQLAARVDALKATVDAVVGFTVQTKQEYDATQSAVDDFVGRVKTKEPQVNMSQLRARKLLSI